MSVDAQSATCDDHADMHIIQSSTLLPRVGGFLRREVLGVHSVFYYLPSKRCSSVDLPFLNCLLRVIPPPVELFPLQIVVGRYVCMYGHTYSKSVDQPGKAVNPARGQLNREKEYFPVFSIENTKKEKTRLRSR